MKREPPRSGVGFDAHAFGKTSREGFVLGGVHIPFESGLVAHSDGDVLLHALCDALLGAAALGDLGRYHPGDKQHKDIDSRELLRQTAARLGDVGFAIVNVDATVIAERPHLAPFVAAMHALIAADLQLSPECVNVKATSTDGLGFTGRGEGIAAFAVASVTRPRSG